MKISLAPLQGYTDWVFRKAYRKHIGGIDEFYTPFLVLQNNGSLKTSHKREVERFAEEGNDLVPQFLCGSVKEFRFFEDYFTDLGYSKMNWNLGCPYPMVTKREKGSGLLPFPAKIQNILEDGWKGKIVLSVKMRLGLGDESEINHVLPALKNLGISEAIIHPRTGKQLYKGTVKLECFSELYNKYGNYLAFNGDINSKSDFNDLMDKYEELQHVMIGRGVLKDHWLPHKIKSLEVPCIEGQKFALRRMHDEILELYSSYLSGSAQILQKMKPFWEYFSFHFENERKVFKLVKKSAGLKKYEQAVAFAFAQNLKTV